MKTQYDSSERVVSLENLKAMCEYVSGMCHRYWIEGVGKSRVWVAYSNPDEYGNERRMIAVFPCYPNEWDPDNPYVVLACLRILHAKDEYDPVQNFQTLLDCPALWHTVTGKWVDKDTIHKAVAIRDLFRALANLP